MNVAIFVSAVISIIVYGYSILKITKVKKLTFEQFIATVILAFVLFFVLVAIFNIFSGDSCLSCKLVLVRK